MTNQWHFDFKDWQEAFEMFYRKRCGEELKDEDTGESLGFRKGNPHIVFVISTAPYVSGYWIEENKMPLNDEHTTIYRTVASVRALEERIKEARDSTVNLSLGRVIV